MSFLGAVDELTPSEKCECSCSSLMFTLIVNSYIVMLCTAVAQSQESNLNSAIKRILESCDVDGDGVISYEGDGPLPFSCMPFFHDVLL